MDTIGDLYEAYVQNNTAFPDSTYFYGNIAKTYKDAVDLVSKLPKIEINSDRIKKLKVILRNYHKKLGLLTPKVDDNIDRINEGVVIAGQQATIFGGSGIIGNKIITSVKMSEIAKEKGKTLVPVFLINTHDGIQPEITTIHLLNNQSSNSKPIHFSNLTEGIAAHKIPINNHKWLNENLIVIKNIFSEFKSSLDKTEFKLFMERVEHILTFLRETYRAASTFGEWMTLIWGIQANIYNDYGVVFCPSSSPEIRKLAAEGYLPFLENRKMYIDEFNKATEKIKEMGFRPTTSAKKDDYSPFFYECPNDGYRITLSSIEQNDDILFHGKCPLDKSEYSFNLNKSKIDLSPYESNLSPRLDSNHSQLQTILPVYIRVSGPGEINYNAQVAPALRKIGVQIPLYVKYTRIHYNTPWIEKLSNDSALEEYSLFSSEFFKTLGVLAKARRKGEIEEMHNASKLLSERIISKISQLKSVSKEPTNPIAKYKSWQFGMYDEYHQWQEVSWPWFVMSSISGIEDYLASYYRYYSKEALVGGIGYINTRL